MNNKLSITIFYGAVVLCIWVMDAAMDAFFFHRGSFSDTVFFHVSPDELYKRGFIIASIVIYRVIASRIVCKRNLAHEALKESEEIVQALCDSSQDAVAIMDHQGNILSWNPAAEKMYGYAADEVAGREFRTLLAPGHHRDAYEEALSGFEKTGERVMAGGTMELTAVKKDGAEFSIELSLSAHKRKGKCHAIGILRDISQRKKYEEELQRHHEQLEELVKEQTEDLRAANELLRDEIYDRRRTEEELCRSEIFLNTIFDSFHDPLSIVDRDYRIVKFNDAFARMRNKVAKDLFGKKCYEVLQNSSAICKNCVVEKTFRSTDPCATKKLVTLPDGSEMWLEIYTYPILDQNQNVSHVIEYARDVTEREKEEKEKKQLIKKLNYLSTTDGLTGLLNRRALIDILNHEIGRADRYGSDLSVILCDVDKLKKINDTHGHIAGDHALNAVSETLRKSLRQADIVGRYGGDEFMIILPETSLAGAESFAEKIRVAVGHIDIGSPEHRPIKLSISIGVACYRTFVETIDTLVARADTALYASKNVGRNKVSVAHT